MSSNWHEMYDEDPVGTSSALLAQQVAAVEAQRAVEQQVGPLIHHAYQQGAQQNDALTAGQIESAYIAANDGPTKMYGADWVEARDVIVQMVNDEPELLPVEARLSPQAMAARLELLYKATREDRRQAKEADAFERIRAAGTSRTPTCTFRIGTRRSREGVRARRKPRGDAWGRPSGVASGEVQDAGGPRRVVQARTGQNQDTGHAVE